jgi:hypothetical protein
MSCNGNSKRCGDAAKRNGIAGQVNQFLNTVGSWDSYRDLNSLNEIPEQLARITAAYFGLKDVLKGKPKLTGILGAILAVHAMEQATGATATFGMRMLVRGKPIGQHRGVILRESPITPRAAKVANRLTGGRVSQAEGYYFHESGRTWHYQSMTLDLPDQPRTLTRIKSFSIPNREFYFDRPVPPQKVVDIVLGDQDPDTIPGFMGKTNELENVTNVIGPIKRAFFAANWLLVDESERDGGQAGYVDYDALVQGKKAGSSTPTRVSPAYDYSSNYGSYSSRRYPSVARATTPAYGTTWFRSEPPAPTGGTTQQAFIEGRHRPIRINRVLRNPVTRTEEAEAIYYDENDQQWKHVTDRAEKEALAEEVKQGNLSVS